MHKGRVEAFSDGVIAIIITIMVLELKVPHGADWTDLQPLLPVFLSYLLSFIYVGIYWNNHHHLFQTVEKIRGAALWANLHLLFWLSLLPFVTAWAGENHFEPLPVMLYGIDLLMCAIAYGILVLTLIRHHGRDSALAHAVGKDSKGNFSIALNLVAVAIAQWQPMISGAIYVVVAMIWLIPDRRMESALAERHSGH